MSPDGTPSVTFKYSFWSNYGESVYGLLLPIVVLVWLWITPTEIPHAEWGIVLLIAYYANLFGMTRYRLAKTPLRISVTPSHVSFEYLGGKTVTWPSPEIDGVEKRKRGSFFFSSDEIAVQRRDGTSVIVLRPDVRQGEEALITALRGVGAGARTRD